MSVQSELSRELHQTLKEMMDIIESGVKGGGPSIVDLVTRIDAIGKEWGKDAPKMLRHYLEKNSYSKALDFLEGRDETAAPNC
jgi:hypothetical protein